MTISVQLSKIWTITGILPLLVETALADSSSKSRRFLAQPLPTPPPWLDRWSKVTRWLPETSRSAQSTSPNSALLSPNPPPNSPTPPWPFIWKGQISGRLYGFAFEFENDAPFIRAGGSIYTRSTSGFEFGFVCQIKSPAFTSGISSRSTPSKQLIFKERERERSSFVKSHPRKKKLKKESA